MFGVEFGFEGLDVRDEEEEVLVGFLAFNIRLSCVRTVCFSLEKFLGNRFVFIVI